MAKVDEAIQKPGKVQPVAAVTPIWKKWWLWVIVVLIVLGIVPGIIWWIV